MKRATLVVWLALCACPGQSAADGPGPGAGSAKNGQDVTAEHYPAAPLAKGHVVLESAYGGQVAVEVEIADTPEATERGMMWRRELAPGKGMLFVFDRMRVQSFWMKNTLIPLDLLFIDSALQVVGVVENAQPLTLTSRAVGRPSRYVLEVPGGWTAKMGVREGSKVTLNLPPGR